MHNQSSHLTHTATLVFCAFASLIITQNQAPQRGQVLLALCSSMKFSRLYKESLLFWPNKISINEGELRPGNGGYFPELSRVWREVELIQGGINVWHEIMSWAMFCGFHQKACEHLQANSFLPVKITEIEQIYLARKVEESLNSTYPSWPRYMKAQFINDTKT